MLTWAQRVAGAFLYRHAFTKGSPVERSWICASARTFLHTATAAHITGGPVCPRWPSSIHCVCQRMKRMWWMDRKTCLHFVDDNAFSVKKNSTRVFVWQEFKQRSEKKHRGIFIKMINDIFPSIYFLLWEGLLPEIMLDDWLIISFAVIGKEEILVLHYCTSVWGYWE